MTEGVDHLDQGIELTDVTIEKRIKMEPIELINDAEPCKKKVKEELNDNEPSNSDSGFSGYIMKPEENLEFERYEDIVEAHDEPTSIDGPSESPSGDPTVIAPLKMEEPCESGRDLAYVPNSDELRAAIMVDPNGPTMDEPFTSSVYDPRHYTCGFCEYKTTKAGNLRNHMRSHTGEKPFACTVCEYRFGQSSDLRRHMRTHTGEKPYSCNQCEYKCIQAGDLKKHVRRHDRENPFRCYHCDFKTASSDSLLEHIRNKLCEQIYACPICKLEYVTFSDLQRHGRVHLVTKPYSCSLCAHTTNDSSNLRKHMKIHSGEKPFSCSECDARFRQASDLRKHFRRHTGEKLTCDHCNYQCMRPYRLKKHVAKYHH